MYSRINKLIDYIQLRVNLRFTIFFYTQNIYIINIQPNLLDSK